MISAGNSVVFNPHPGARAVTLEAINVLNEAIAGAGGPNDASHDGRRSHDRDGAGADASQEDAAPRRDRRPARS